MELNSNHLADVCVEVRADLANKKINVKDILHLGNGSIIEFDKNYQEPVTLYVNNIKYAEGEVVSVDENYGIRITKIFDPNERK